MIFDEKSFWKLMFVVSFLNLFVLLEPFLNREGYRALLLTEQTRLRDRAWFFLVLNVAFMGWALVMSVRV